MKTALSVIIIYLSLCGCQEKSSQQGVVVEVEASPEWRWSGATYIWVKPLDEIDGKCYRANYAATRYRTPPTSDDWVIGSLAPQSDTTILPSVGDTVSIADPPEYSSDEKSVVKLYRFVAWSRTEKNCGPTQ